MEDTPDDKSLFRQAMADVRPLPTDKRHDHPRRPRPRRRRAADTDSLLGESLTMSPFERLLETGEELNYCSEQLSRQAYRRLRRGEYAVQDEIDLHGMSVARAREVLIEFIAESLRQHHRCVRIVHGKGMRSGPRGPVLKQEVNRWLRQWDSVLGFASTPPRDGGTGAVYVLLRRG
ncbi:MAG: Smr/MutS family protein [Gammaproteobacteria bacterium]|nr:Smr/MutS family protein [Gammaproteobacteria bacterium]